MITLPSLEGGATMQASSKGRDESAMPPARRSIQNEADRLRALYAFDILDTEPELSFDRITDLAARLFDAPIALVTLVDQQRQWFKSCVGLSVRQTPNSVSFCKHTLDSDEVLVIPDALADARFKDNPLVTGEPNIRFYAGAPLITSDGYNLGSLCVIDDVPRDDLSEADRRTLRDLADIVIDEMDLRRIHRTTEAGLRQHAERVVQAIELAGDAVGIIDADGRFVFVNDAHRDMYGYTAQELAGEPLMSLYDDAGREFYARQVIPTLRREGMWQGPCTARHRDGTPVEQEVSLSLMPDGGMIRVARDVSARNAAERKQKRLEAELHQAQKLEAIGRLAGGIAHDFNNILAAIEGYAGFLADDLVSHSREAGYARQILTASERGKTLIQQILSFSRRDPLAMQPLDVAEVVGETTGLLRAALPKDIAIDCDLPSEMITVRGNQTALARAVMNLATNARDAVDPHAGRVSVSVRERSGSPADPSDPDSEDHEVEGLGRVRLTTLPDGRSALRVGQLEHSGSVVELAVTDNGSGIRPEILQHVLEPFYTTKATGSGTGLGLSAVAGIALSHGGGLTIESAPGRGTRVVLHLPQVGADTDNAAPAAPSAPDRPAVLVVDDEKPVAEMIGDAIRRLGRRAITTTSPTQALQILERERHQIACVVTDLMMPEMIGSNLAEKVKQVAPEVMVVLCSGRSFLSHQVDNPAIDHVLEKPICRQALAAVFGSPQDDSKTPAAPDAPDPLPHVAGRDRG